jgi:two-component system cell cycle response regulator
MTARVLVVDDVPANVKLLEAKLSAEYFDVLTARDGLEALDVAKRELPDIVLLDVMMPGLDGFEVCRRLKADTDLRHIPVVMVTALDQVSDRVQGLEAGADDFLTKPFRDLPLFARVRSLLRLKMLTDELRLREATGQRLGLLDGHNTLRGDIDGGRILVIEDNPRMAERLAAPLVDAGADVCREQDANKALERARTENFDAFVVSLSLRDYDGLRLCSHLRSFEGTRHTPILILVDDDDGNNLVRALDIGINDYLIRPVDRNELLARARTQLRRKRYQDQLRSSINMSMEMAVTDGLTGLHNRRYMMSHLANLMERAISDDRALSVVLLDIDHFKPVNDTHGHQAGDAVLQEVAGRIRRNVRGSDLPARYGGEEFGIVMPETDQGTAALIAERLCQNMSETAITVPQTPQPIAVTVSLGVATLAGASDNVDSLLKRADDALYRAKREGRNRVIVYA